MQNFTTRIIWVIAIIFSSLSNATKLTFAVDDYCPYYCKDYQASPTTFTKQPGYVIEILNHAFATPEYQLSYLFVPWERGLAEIHKYYIDAIIVSAKLDAPKLVYPEQPQGLSIGCFASRMDSTWRYHNIDSLYDIRLGVIKGYRYGQPVDSAIWQYHEPEIQVTKMAGAKAIHRLLNMVNKNRIDAVIDDQNVLLHVINELNLSKSIKISGCTEQSIAFYVGFSPNNPKAELLAATLSNTMIKLRESGELAKILSKYNVNDWQEIDTPKIKEK